MMMNPKLIVSAAAAAVALCGCASAPDFNDGPYARHGFTYDFGLSPIAPLNTEDAQTVLALPATTGPGTFILRNGKMIYSEPSSHVIPTVVEAGGSPTTYVPAPPPPHAP